MLGVTVAALLIHLTVLGMTGRPWLDIRKPHTSPAFMDSQL